MQKEVERKRGRVENQNSPITQPSMRNPESTLLHRSPEIKQEITLGRVALVAVGDGGAAGSLTRGA